MWHTLLVVSMTAVTGLYTVMGTTSQSPTGGASSSYGSTASQESRRQLESMYQYRRAVIEYFKKNPSQLGYSVSQGSLSLMDAESLQWRNYRDNNGLVYIYVAKGHTVAADLYSLLVEKTYKSELVGIYRGVPTLEALHLSKGEGLSLSSVSYYLLAQSIQPGTPVWASNTVIPVLTSSSGTAGSKGS